MPRINNQFDAHLVTEAHLETLSRSLCQQPEGVSLSIIQRYELMDSLALATGTRQATTASIRSLQQGSNTGPHSDRKYRNGLSVCQCACALLPFFFPFFPHAQLRWLTETQGNSLPFLERLEFSFSTSSSSSHFPHTPVTVKLVSPTSLFFRAPLGRRFRQMAPKKTLRPKGNVHVAAHPKPRTYLFSITLQRLLTN